MSVMDIDKRDFPFVLEVFPPKTRSGMRSLQSDLAPFASLEPGGICCAYSPGGADAGKNMELLKDIAAIGRDLPITRFTLAGNTPESALPQLQAYLDQGICHILAQEPELAVFLRREFGSQFTIAVSCDPETDTDTLKQLCDNGIDRLVVRVCWDTELLLRRMDAVRTAGITCPIMAEIFPALDQAEVISTIRSRSGVIPRPLSELISRYWIHPNPFTKDSFDAQAEQKKLDFRSEGAQYTIQQIRQYQACGVSGVHLLTRNRFEDTALIIDGFRRDPSVFL